MTKEEEQRLVKSAQDGDASAFEALVLDNQKIIYNLALKLTGSPDDALDVSQDAFLKAYQNLGAFRGESRFSVWLYRLCYNAAMDHLRRTRRGNVISLTVESEEGEDAELDIADTAPPPDEVVEKRALREAVRTAIKKLPEDKREILVMREFSGMSYTDIAEALGLDEGTVKSRLSRARSALAEILKKDGTFSAEEQSKKRKGGLRNA